MTCPVKTSQAVGGGYDEFWNCEKRYRVLKGGKGSKKSSVTALNLIFRLLKYPESNLLVVRAVMNTHRDSTFAQLRWAQEKLGVEKLFSCTVSPMEMTYTPTGQKILFRGFDDVLKLASTTVTKGFLNFVWIEEAFEIEREADFEKLDLSVPRGRIPAGMFKQTTVTFNPWSRDHWLKKRFFDKESPDTAVFSTDYTCNEFLDATDIAVFEKMKRDNPRKYAVAGLGEWGISEGLVFENWVVGDPPEGLGKGDWTAYFGLDYGYVNDPTAFIAFYCSREKKQIYVFDEFYKKGMLNSEIAAEITKRGYRKERIRADSSEPKSNEDLRRLGITRIVPSVKGNDSILNGISAISEYRITVDPKCVNTVSELSNYVYTDNLNAKGMKMPCDRNNHLMDALRYAFEDVKNYRKSEVCENSGAKTLLRRWNE